MSELEVRVAELEETIAFIKRYIQPDVSVTDMLTTKNNHSMIIVIIVCILGFVGYLWLTYNIESNDDSPNVCNVMDECMGDTCGLNNVDNILYPNNAPNTQHDALNTQHDANTSHNALNTQHNAPNTQHDANTSHNAPNTQHDVSNTQHDVSNTQHDVSNTRHDAPNTRHDASSTPNRVNDTQSEEFQIHY
uniref:Uncharacterized protein n=1 Tax=Megaviridae environmental sample TaxID=1737588 RepID=A0A5J6VK03_9VIRU|nr:MAG: hypothetical protein [Megaviridae environmental sample]